MANKRMFSMDIVDSDAFLDMPASTQNLYFHLGMRADDDGFLNNPKRVARVVGASDDDLKLLLTKRFLIAFDSGVVVIKHWKMNNYIPKDRHKPTAYQEELSMLKVKSNGAYTDCIQDVYKLDTQSSLDQSSLDQNRLDKNRLDQSSSDDMCIQTGNSICDGLTEAQWDSLEQHFEDVKGLIDLIDRRLGLNISSVKNPYSYILKVAKDERWATKS